MLQQKVTPWVVLTLLLLVATSFSTATLSSNSKNTGGSWLSSRGNSQNSKYIPIRLGYYTGRNYSHSALGYGPSHFVGLDNGFGAVPNYGEVHKMNLRGKEGPTPVGESLSISGSGAIHTTQLHPHCSTSSSSSATTEATPATTTTFISFIADMADGSPSQFMVAEFLESKNTSAPMTQKWKYLFHPNRTSYQITGTGCVVFIAECYNKSSDDNNNDDVKGQCDLSILDLRSGTPVTSKIGLLSGKGATILSLALSSNGVTLFWGGSSISPGSEGDGVVTTTFSALSVVFGTSIWTRSWSLDGGSSGLTSLVYSEPTDSLVACWLFRQIFTLDGKTGKTRWSRPAYSGDAPMSPAVDDTSLYLPINRTLVTRLSLKDGSTLKTYSDGKYANDLLVFEDAVVIQQSQAGDEAVIVCAKETGQVVSNIPTPLGYFNKKLGFASGLLWVWSGAEGGPVRFFEFY